MQIRFVVGTGRSGTLALSRALGQFEGFEAHHEYNFEPVLQAGILHFLGKRSEAETIEFLRAHYLPAIARSKADCWVDCSNALPWLIRPLARLLPEARFLFVARHGKRVVSSFFHKFTVDMYEESAVEALARFLRDDGPMPPALKRFWRPLPVPGSADEEWFAHAGRFERLCYYWRTTNDEALAALEELPRSRWSQFRLEDILGQPSVRADFFGRFPLPADSMAAVENALARPINVARPITYPLTSEEEAIFARRCASTMARLHYPLESDYAVAY